jgi:hypothetical protein
VVHNVAFPHGAASSARRGRVERIERTPLTTAANCTSALPTGKLTSSPSLLNKPNLPTNRNSKTSCSSTAWRCAPVRLKRSKGERRGPQQSVRNIAADLCEPISVYSRITAVLFSLRVVLCRTSQHG